VAFEEDLDAQCHVVVCQPLHTSGPMGLSGA
jgi:hypothetical protein